MFTWTISPLASSLLRYGLLHNHSAHTRWWWQWQQRRRWCRRRSKLESVTQARQQQRRPLRPRQRRQASPASLLQQPQRRLSHGRQRSVQRCQLNGGSPQRHYLVDNVHHERVSARLGRVFTTSFALRRRHNESPLHAGHNRRRRGQIGKRVHTRLIYLIITLALGVGVQHQHGRVQESTHGAHSQRSQAAHQATSTGQRQHRTRRVEHTSVVACHNIVCNIVRRDAIVIVV